ncbi:5-oxoprolinase/urea amidolyase family protein [Castellaniella sp. GW247-6E4]|uniref:5-oxoprolinase subunit B/C family protein n=1 Tax=Castellaniella sp. GW247-6E4 TaxID=3140380 RepID=UPI00331594F6
MRLLPAGDRALLVELGSLEQTLAVFQALRQHMPGGVEEVVPAARTLLVRYQPSRVSSARLAAEVHRLVGLSGEAAAFVVAAPSDRLVEIPVRYDGEDLEAVAELLGLSRAEVIERHVGTEFQAAFAGFAPGFVYLAGGDPCFHGVPRRPSPRTRVPAGSVAMAGDFSAVYPSESPGGWQLLGVTPCRMWDLARTEPALVQPGFRVRFRDLARGDIVVSLPGAEATAAAAQVAPHVAALAADRLEVVAAGLRTLVQDLGRRGQAGQGVSSSGALDHGALRAANRIVGNPVNAAVLENLLGGLALRCRGRAVVAVTGAAADVEIVTAAGRRLPVRTWRPLALNDGETLRIGAAHAGVRCYVAVRGGWGVEPVLGSHATDTLSGIGPAPVRVGDVLGVGSALAPSALGAVLPDIEPPAPAPRAGDTVTLDVVLGPRADWFIPDALTLLAAQAWTVTPQSDRVGMRLAGAQPLARRIMGELPSEGAVVGSIQVPASGQPVLFLADHPLTGGYPVIGALASHELDRAAQIPVGAHVYFRPIGPFEEIQP